jgi:hypothetical protein
MEDYKHLQSYYWRVHTWNLQKSSEKLRKKNISMENDNCDHVDGASLSLWTAPTNGPTVHPPGDKQGEPRWNDIGGETPDSYTRALSSILAAEPSSSISWEVGKCDDEFSLRSIFVHVSKGSLTCRMALTGLLSCLKAMTYQTLMFYAIRFPLLAIFVNLKEC